MIKQEKGRAKSIRTIEEEVKQLQKKLQSFSEEEREFLKRLLREDGEESGETVRKINKAHYKHNPVDIDTFLDDPYYSGPGGQSVYPKLRGDLREIFGGKYTEAIQTGGIGWGKSFSASYGLLYSIYRLTCLRDPQSTFGISPGSKIYFALMSGSRQQAKRGIYADITRKIESSPYFQELGSECLTWEARVTDQITILCSSIASNDILGLNVFGGIVDEVNFGDAASFIEDGGTLHGSDQPMTKAEKVYKKLVVRIKSRFMRLGAIPGVMFLVSSKNTDHDFTQRRIANNAKSSNVYVMDYPEWGPKPDDKYSGDTFRVFFGGKSARSKILEEGEDPPDVDDPDAKVVEVPIEYYSDFNSDLEEALRDIAGIAVPVISPYFHRVEKVHAITNYREDEPIPVKGSEWRCQDNSTPFRWDVMVDKSQETVTKGFVEDNWIPKLNPGAPRHVHIDPSLGRNDPAGFCMGHIAKYVDVAMRDEDTGDLYKENKPLIYIDAVFRILPPVDGDIQLQTLRRLIYELRGHGFDVSYVSMDSYQCLAEGTRVNTDRGLIPIEEVEEGDVVQSRVGPKPVEKVWEFGKRETLRITTSDGDVLEGTGRHRIEVEKSFRHEKTDEGYIRQTEWEWKRLDELEEGDVIHVVSDPVEVDADNYQLKGSKEDTVWRNMGGRKSKIDRWNFPDQMTPELAEWLGLIWGDGDIQKDGVRLSVHPDDKDDAVSSFERVFGCGFEYQSCSSRKGGVVRVHARWLVEWMGMNNLHKPDIPEAIFRSSKRVKAAFLKGLFAADGSVGNGQGGLGTVSLSTVHRSLAQDVRVMLRSEFGIPSNLTIQERGHGGDFVEDGQQYIVCVRGPRARFYESVGFTYSSKQSILEDHLDVEGRDLRVRVENIERSEASVYDLQVKDDPSYVANGIVSHNSADTIQQLKSQGFQAEVKSLNRDSTGYGYLRSSIYQDRVLSHPCPPLIEELTALQYNSKTDKVDHPKNGSDDIADALAGVVWTLSERDTSLMQIPEETPDATDRDPDHPLNQWYDAHGGGSSGGSAGSSDIVMPFGTF